MQKNKLIFCACKCGKKVEKYNKWGRPRKFIHGHNGRGQTFEEKFGKERAKEIIGRITLANKKGKIIKCENCGKKFYRSEAFIKQNKKSFCNYKCYWKFLEGKTWEEYFGKEKAEELRKKITLSGMGEKNPNWQNGKSFEPYTLDFNSKFKRKIRKRDNYICMLCGIHQEKLPKALTIHHANYNKILSIPQNCISLCNRCNGLVNSNRDKWIVFFQNLLKEKYGYKYSEDQKIILDFTKIDSNKGG